MPLRLFGGRGGGKARACPACRGQIATDATFCPSCYMVFRPEGAADLRHHLQGARIPSDVYLLRKLQIEDPDIGPVIRVQGGAPAPPVAAPPKAEPPRAAPGKPASRPSDSSLPHHSEPPGAPLPPRTPKETAAPPQGRAQPRPAARTRTGVEALLAFAPPLPPAAHSVQDTPGLLGWMLERDPVIPNNLELLEAIHAEVFQEGLAAHLGYQQHVLLQIADDLTLSPTQESLEIHLAFLATAYRRAAGAYREAAATGQEAKSLLWQMSSIASRLRLEAWVFHTRHGNLPRIARAGRPRHKTPKASGH